MSKKERMDYRLCVLKELELARSLGILGYRYSQLTRP